MYLIADPPMTSRGQFGTLLSERGLNGDAVEVGTHRGQFAEMLLSNWPKGRLFCVDPWLDRIPGYEGQDVYLPAKGPDRTADLGAAKELLTPYLDRVMFMEMRSDQAVKKFYDRTLDFVYVDGNHYYEHVVQDLMSWWPKLKHGGILAGHDIVCPWGPRPDNWGKHIQPAVQRFSDLLGLDVYLVVETADLPWSYYMVKR